MPRGYQPGAPRSRPGRGAPWYFLAALVLILLIFGWIVALMALLLALCVGFVLTQQRKQERRERHEQERPQPSEVNRGSGPPR
jgi:Flp pilus assembly protein TadB